MGKVFYSFPGFTFSLIHPLSCLFYFPVNRYDSYFQCLDCSVLYLPSGPTSLLVSTFSLVPPFSLFPLPAPRASPPHVNSGLLHLPLGASTTEACFWPFTSPVPLDRE